VLIERNTLTCGTRSAAPPLSCLWSGVTSQQSAQVAGALAAANPELSQLSRLDQSVLHAGERKVRLVSIEGGETSFFATWEQGTTRFSLVDPTGKVIDPAYAASIQGDPNDPENVETTEPDPDVVLYSAEATHAVYYFPKARPGTWQLVYEGGADVPAAGTTFTTAASFDSPLRATFSSDRDFYDPGATALLRVSFSEPVLHADVQVTLRRAGGTTETVYLPRLQGDAYAASYALPQASGYVALDWSVSGQRSDGTAFERGGREYIQLHSQALRLERGHTDRAIPRTDAPGLNSALAVTLKVLSDYAGGKLGVYAELTAADGTVVARTHTSVLAQAGQNAVELRFRAEDLYLSKADGPYTLRNVRLLDERDAPLLSQEVVLAHTTQAYAYRSFAPQLGTPGVFLDGPFQVQAGESVSLTAVGVDPEGDVLSYAWDLDGDGQFEVSGLPVTFSTSVQDRAGLRKVRVQVSDSEGHSAVAEDFVDIVNACTPNAGTFSLVGNTAALHLQHSSTRLEDGRVLVVGGYSRAVEVYDPATGTWGATGSSRTTHRNHTATLLSDGRVLVAGGEGASATASAEVYDAATGTWAATGNLGTYRRHHGAVRLQDGRVLVMGGTDASGALLASAEVYDPASGTWSAAQRMAQARRTFSATLLGDGRVLVAGGLTDASSDKCNSTGSNCLTSVEVYDPATGTWASVGGMATARGYHAAVLLASGQVLVVGGAMDGAQSTTAELYDPATGAWMATGSLHSPRRRLALSVLPDGRVLATGGYDASTGILATAELYDPAAGTWCPTGSMAQGRYGHTATVLKDGRVLVTTGNSNASQYTSEVYDLGGMP
jgi:WD40 repeat protein